ncbi:ABC transporter transmembrane domain-containing protein [Sutterella wadsworthensis]|uniref:ABC transporter transmembrane domain-containing protein n=1 Tax=Sutterella wadsworthensis TaxID=40545 RepID=UPI003A915FD2
MVVMARMSQNVLVTLRNSFFSRAPQYQMFSIGRMSVKFVNKDTSALSGATESFMVLVRDSMLAVALLAVTFWRNWQLMLMTVFLVAASPFVLRSISLRRRLIVNASQDNVGAMHSRVEESYGAQKLVKAACSCDSDGRHFAPVKAALARLARGKTTVTTIAYTDWIVALDNGVVHEQGTEAELLVRPSGLFHQLYKLQTAGRTHP